MYLPSLQTDEKSQNDITRIFCNGSNLVSVAYEPVGRWLEAYLKRQRSENSLSFSEDRGVEQDILGEENEAELSSDEITFLLSLDPAEWKKQDHYRVLGLSHLRLNASDEDIKQAYRKKVLQHHPDKKDKNRKSKLPPGVNEHGYFTCITKAYECLSTISGRQAYDSVDPSFDDSIPPFNPNKDDFFCVFAPVFKNNSRWSQVQPVPLLGDLNSSQDYVNDFYSFWYEFKSWRNFSYMDEEDPDKAESREERRWMERENKHMRQKRKKDEIRRITNIVELAFNNDVRLKKFREEQKQKKIDLKRAKELAVQEKEQERKLKLEMERQEREKVEQETKAKALKEKKEKEKLKKAAARDRKVIRQVVRNEHFFDTKSNEVENLQKLEQLLENLSLDHLQELREKAECTDMSQFKEAYMKNLSVMCEKLKQQEEEKRRLEEAASQASSKQPVSSHTPEQTWSDDEKQLLVKATTLFPIGTASRWDVIAAYINEHSGSNTPKTGKQVINKVKNLKKLDPSLKDEANQMAYRNLEKVSNKLSCHITNDISVKDPGPTDIPWTSDEQKLLEQALKKFGSSTPERWEKIASLIPTRTKKECMKRYKELVEIIKAKKAASSNT